MPPEEAVAEWLALAEADIRAVRILLAADAVNAAAFHAQQALEKALKGALLASGVRPPRTHDLAQLNTLWTERFPFGLEDGRLEDINAWQIVGRYPDIAEPAPSSAEVAEAIANAEQLVAGLRAKSQS